METRFLQCVLCFCKTAIFFKIYSCSNLFLTGVLFVPMLTYHRYGGESSNKIARNINIL